jgi:DNA-binding transcriptional ArsR family regulator
MVESRTGQQAEHLNHVFNALAHPVRRKILQRVASKEHTVSELAAPFDISLEAVSKHITILERAKLLRRTRAGREHRCRLEPAPLTNAAKVLAKLAGLWHERLDALESVLEEIQAKG